MERGAMQIFVDKEGPESLTRQVYNGIRQQILTGMLPPGRQLPASRKLAAELGIARNVILDAYDLLYAEGFIRSAQGSGTYVAEGAMYSPSPEPEAVAAEPVHMGYDTPAGKINFRSGTPDLSLFPVKIWLQLLREGHVRYSVEALGYGHPEGRPELRQAIREYVVANRGVRCHPDQIVITAGTTQAIGITARLLLAERREVVVEDPITRDIRLIITNLGGRIRPVEVGDKGLMTDRLPTTPPAFIYVTPSHQYPVGVTMPIQQRLELLRYAERTSAYVIEDDYDSEFRFDGPPISSLHSLNPERVVYIGTFSKTLCPAIRTGYLILPPQLITRGREQKWHSDLHNVTATQLALARFIAGGHYQQHLGRMKRLYGQRRQVVVKALADLFGNRAQVLGSATGLHLCVRFPGIVFNAERLAEIEHRGARFYPAAAHAAQTRAYDDSLIIGYGNLQPEEIRAGLVILRTVI